MRFNIYDTVKKQFVENEPYGDSYMINMDGSVTVTSYRDKGNDESRTYKDRFIVSIADEKIV